MRLAVLAGTVFAAAGALGASTAAHASTHSVGALPRLRDQPPLAHTGGFGEPTCLACHADGQLNEPGGSVAVDGAPQRYEPGKRYRLTISVRHPELKLAGFELAVRFTTGADSGKQAGSLSVDDERAGVSMDSTTRVQYAHHLRSGTTPLTPGVGRWTVFWVAPEGTVRPVTINVASNAANDNDSPMGDYIYARGISISAGEK